MRVGHGVDIHRFADEVTAGATIRLGGVDVPSDRKLLAHSDGDVLIHALCDALLGAAALGDIGEHFPDTDPRYHNADSRGLLTEVLEKVRARGWVPANVDISVMAQTPRLSPYKASMVTSLAGLLGLDAGAVNVKATTTEKLGAVGRCEGIACHAVVLLLPA